MATSLDQSNSAQQMDMSLNATGDSVCLGFSSVDHKVINEGLGEPLSKNRNTGAAFDVDSSEPSDSSKKSLFIHKYKILAAIRSNFDRLMDIPGQGFKPFPTRDCMMKCRSIDQLIKLKLNSETGSVKAFDVKPCKSVWACPYCAERIAIERGQQFQFYIQEHLNAGGDVFLMTLTVPHRRQDSPFTLDERFQQAHRALFRSRRFRKLMADAGYLGCVKSPEYTWGEKNGVHPHLHVLLFVESGVVCDMLQEHLYQLWVKECLKVGLRKPSRKRGVDLQRGHVAGDYITKMGWNAAAEMARSDMKLAHKDNFSVFGLVAEFIKTGNRKYLDAYKLIVQLSWGKNFTVTSRKIFAAYRDRVDALIEELTLPDGTWQLLQLIPINIWHDIWGQGHWPELQRIAKEGDKHAVAAFISRVTSA